MNLRLRTVSIIALTLVALLVALYFASSTILLKGFSRLEQQQVQAEIERVGKAVHGALSALESHAKDWAFWDDTYAFMADGNAQYRRSNLTPGTFSILNLDLLLYLHPGGETLFAAGYVEGSSAVFTLSPDTIGQIVSATDAHRWTTDRTSTVTGLISLNGHPALVALAPILPGDRTGANRGVLVMGRYLTTDYVRKIADTSRLNVSLLSSLPTGGGALEPRVQIEGPDRIVAYIPLPDLSGVPVAALRLDVARSVFQQGAISQRYLLINVVIVGLVFLVVVAVVLERVFLSRLARIDKTVAIICQEHDRSRRLPVHGTDELERLAATINETLDALADSEEQLRHDALHDPLTGLANRTLFINRLEAALKKASRSRRRCAVLLVDLDHFKLINDSFGHSTGDQFLLKAARRMGGVLRSVDTVARLGGDEFGILLDWIDEEDEAPRCAERIVRALDNPVTWQGHQLHVTASIGIAVYTGDDTMPEDLLRDADTAMYRAKQVGRNGYALFDEAMHAQVVTRLEMESDLRRAVDAGELRACYQPCFDLHSGELRGFEALVRWQHPRRGLLAPDEFIPVAENAGLVSEIDHWMLLQACAALARWQTPSTRAPLTMSVNLSCRQERLRDMVVLVQQVLKDTGLPGSRIGLEITESALARAESELLELIFDLKRDGIRIYLDDFGTGYSSLSRLHHLPIDVLKIDRSFVADIERGDMEVARTIITLAHNLGMEVVAEGIETEGQIARLRALGCEYAQGFLFSKPLVEADAIAFIARSETRVWTPGRPRRIAK